MPFPALLSPRVLTISWYILLIYYLSPRLEWQLQEGRDVCLPHRSIYSAWNRAWPTGGAQLTFVQ